MFFSSPLASFAMNSSESIFCIRRKRIALALLCTFLLILISKRSNLKELTAVFEDGIKNLNYTKKEPTSSRIKEKVTPPVWNI